MSSSPKRASYKVTSPGREKPAYDVAPSSVIFIEPAGHRPPRDHTQTKVKTAHTPHLSVTVMAYYTYAPTNNPFLLVRNRSTAPRRNITTRSRLPAASVSLAVGTYRVILTSTAFSKWFIVHIDAAAGRSVSGTGKISYVHSPLNHLGSRPEFGPPKPSRVRYRERLVAIRSPRNVQRETSEWIYVDFFFFFFKYSEIYLLLNTDTFHYNGKLSTSLRENYPCVTWSCK